MAGTGTEVAKISVKVTPNTHDFRRQLKKELEAIEKGIKADIAVTVHLNTAQAMADFERLKRTIERRRISVGVDVYEDKHAMERLALERARFEHQKARDAAADARRAAKNNSSIWDTSQGAAGGGAGIAGKFIPNFGSGINPAGYVAIVAAAAVLAAPLVGLISTAILAIPGVITMITTPIMAIALGLDGIKSAASKSGLVKLNKDGEFDGLGAAFDNVKAKVSKAFDEGLTPSFDSIVKAIDPLLGSLPKVATGLTDMFAAFTESLTSDEGIRLFDSTIRNVGAAMSQAAPGVQAFTTGMLNLANNFTAQLPGLSSWFNRTGESFSKWVDEMTKKPDPAGHHGPAGQKSKMDLAFEGLGDTLKTIGEWAVDMGKAGLKFAQDPQKMKDFLSTLDDIGTAITKLVELGNRLAPLWKIADKVLPEVDKMPNVPGVQEAPSGKKPPVPADLSPKTVEKDVFGKIEEWGVNFWDGLKESVATWMDRGGATSEVGGVTIPNDISTDKLQELIGKESTRLKGEIAGLEKAVAARSDGGFKQASSDALNRYKAELEQAKADLAELSALAASNPNVALKSSERPLDRGVGGSGYDAGKAGGIGKAMDEAAAQVPQQAAKIGQAIQDATSNVKVEPPDMSAFNSGLNEIPATANAAMQAMTAALQQGGAQAAATSAQTAEMIKTPFLALQGTMVSIGLGIAQGLANGITAGTGFIVAAAAKAALAAKDSAKLTLDSQSPSKVFMRIGEDTMKGMAIGIDKGYAPVVEQAKDVASKVAAAFATGTDDPTALLAGFSKGDINNMEKVLRLEITRLDNQARGLELQAKLNKDDGAKARAQSLRDTSSELKMHKEMLDLTGDYAKSGSGSSGEDPFAKAAAGLMAEPVNFAKATGKQFLSDIGIGGNGFISKAITEGISYVFNIGTVDEAMSIKDRSESNIAMSMFGGR